MYTALHPDTVATLTIAGAPVDFHAGEPLIHDWIRLLSPLGQMDIYRVLVTANGGVLPGDALLTGFKIMQPEVETDRQLQLLAHIDDGAYTERYRKFENWFQHTQPIPGGFCLWIVEHLFIRNELVHGELMVGGSASTSATSAARSTCSPARRITSRRRRFSPWPVSARRRPARSLAQRRRGAPQAVHGPRGLARPLGAHFCQASRPPAARLIAGPLPPAHWPAAGRRATSWPPRPNGQELGAERVRRTAFASTNAR